MTQPRHHTNRQFTSRGIALPTVMVMLLLTSGWVLTAWRSVWLHELLIQARSDAWQTQWVADATLIAALEDVLPRNSQAEAATDDDRSFTPATDLRHKMGRPDQSHVFFPKTVDELRILRQRLGADVCREGICAPLQPLLSNTTVWQSMLPSAMPIASENNPLPSKNASYWVEIFLSNDASEVQPFVYRITAMANGWKSAKPTVIQAVWQPNNNTADTSNNTPQSRWTSWAVLHAPR